MERQIEPVSIWLNGQLESANLFNMISIDDNLLDNAVFYYQLLKSDTSVEPINEIQLAQGNLKLGPDEYSNWDGSNDWIMNWAAIQLNLVFL
jgi:Arc/MetJ family transcription regulator